MLRMGRKREKGITILEALLALVIGMTILFLSLQQYVYYRRDADAQALQATVDLLFQSLANYFRAHCDKTRFSPADPIDDLRNFYPLRYKPITLQTLMDEGFLSLPNNRLPDNSLVDNTSPIAYILQLNQYQTGSGPIPLPRRSQDLSPSGSTSIGYELIWQAQVSVKLRNTTIARSLLGILNADCLSSPTPLGGGWITTPCSSAPGSSIHYVVWGRAPSYSSAGSQSDYWVSMPTARQFKQMYTTDPILILTDPSSGVTPQRNAQFFTCGS